MPFVLFLAVLALLILAHELGHFLIARKNGIRVEEFGIGFPPRLFKIKRGETIYSLNLIPFGGFVKIYGEDQRYSNDPASFASKPVLRRALVVLGGVLFNFLLAWAIISFSFMTGAPNPSSYPIKGATVKQNVGVVLMEVQGGSPAERAGLKEGDILLSLESKDGLEKITVRNAAEVKNFIDRNRGREIRVRYRRGKEIFVSSAVPRINTRQGEGALGIAMGEVQIISLPPHRALWEGLKTSISVTKAVFLSIYHLLAGALSGGGGLGKVLGPVGIISLTGSVAKIGFNYLLNFIALLSINLAVINILPFPALDGGRLIFLLIEKLKGSPLNSRTINFANTVGFLVLMLLLVFITFKDIQRILH